MNRAHPLNLWVNDLRESRRGYNRATVAVANKTARIIWIALRNLADPTVTASCPSADTSRRAVHEGRKGVGGTPIRAGVRRTGRCAPSTTRMISSLAAVGYLIRGGPNPGDAPWNLRALLLFASSL